jgi:YkoY family integral membrane protein
MPPVLFGEALFNIMGQTLEARDLIVIVLLIILEGVLSIDNALVLGILAKRLPKFEQGRALTYGLVGAFVFRIIAVCTASLLLQWTIAKFLGGAYLVYIAVKHLFFEAHEQGETQIELDEHGHPKLTDPETGGPPSKEQEETELRERQPLYMDPATRKALGLAAFWPTVLQIELTDIAFAIDSILAAIAFVGSAPKGHNPNDFHPKLWLVIVGGMLGVILMRFAAVIFIKLLEKFPRFETAAYILVVLIGAKLLGDWGLNSDWSFKHSPRWMAAAVQPVQPFFENVEKARLGAVRNYEAALDKYWIFEPSSWGGNPFEHHGDPNDPMEQTHVPHLLDFHHLTRPECIAFWISMLLGFAVGFLPKKEKPKEGLPLGEKSE